LGISAVGGKVRWGGGRSDRVPLRLVVEQFGVDGKETDQ